MPGFFIQKGIKLKDHFRKERKKQRELQAKYQLSSYLNPLIAEMVCKLSYKNGMFSFPNGEIPHGRYLFIRTLEGKIFAAKEENVAHHSYLSNGKKVLSAGYFIFRQGKLILVSNESGHYTPTNEEFFQEIKFYLSISQNEDLIYEDHSSFPLKQEIYHYMAKQILIDNWQPLAVYKNVQSNFGKKLKSSNEALMNETKSNNIETQKNSHYLPDSQLLLPIENENQKVLMVGL